MNTVRSVLEKMGYTIPAADTYANITLWMDWYKGYHDKFHSYTQYNGKTRVKRRRQSLKMAKKVCEDHANLQLNEKVQITVADKKMQIYLDAALKANDFRKQGNWLVEVAYALGTGAFVEYPDGQGGVVIDYIRADMIFPLSWEGRKITECAFASVRTNMGKKMIYINVHVIEGGEYVVYNKLIPADGDAPEIKPDDGGLLPGGVAAVVHTGSMTPRYQLIYPNIVNNLDLDCPLGISVYANSIDLLESIDMTYDSYHTEFRLGKKRIIVNGAATRIVIDPTTGDTLPIFDDADTEFYGLPDLGDGKNSTEIIHEINMELRAAAHELGLQRFLNMLSDKCGLGSDRYIFTQGTAKTATEVISEKSELYQNLKKNELVLDDALKDMCQAIAEIGEFRTPANASINFDDSIIEDEAAKRTRMQLFVTQGKFPFWRYLVEYEGYDETTAQMIAAEAEDAAGEKITFGKEETPKTPEDTAATQAVSDAAGKTLNGAQVQSLINVVKSVKAGDISRSAAIAVITSAFGMTEEQAAKLLAPAS